MARRSGRREVNRYRDLDMHSFFQCLCHHALFDKLAQDDSMEFSKIFPTFTWVIRDFALGLVDEDGDPISGTQYLDNSLKPVKGFDKQTVERNRIRSMLSSFFSKRQCMTLVRPCNDEDALQQIDNIPFTDLREEFQRSMKELRSLIFDHLVPKTVLGGRSLNGTLHLR
jgi:hypothetical protein